MEIETNGDRVRHAIQVYAEKCRTCTEPADKRICYDCETSVALEALKHLTPVHVEYDHCSACGEEVGRYDEYCYGCGSPFIGRGSKWE